MAALEIKCPAGEERHPVLSPNDMDVECRIQGNLRPAADRRTGEPVVCCADYQSCAVWRHHVEVERMGPSTKKQRDQVRTTRRAPDVLTHA